MRVAIYARVSTVEQRLDPQLDELREFCRRQGFEIVREYVDHGESGAAVFGNPESDHRRLRQDAREAKTFRAFDGIVIWKFDRFARSASELLRALEEFQQGGIQFISMRERVDTTSIYGKFLFTILAAVAEMERGLNSERTRAGLAAARRRGKKLGRPLRISPERAAKMVELHEKGMSLNDLVKYFHVSKGLVVGICKGTASAVRKSRN